MGFLEIIGYLITLKNTQLSTTAWNPYAAYWLQFLNYILETKKSWYYSWSNLICGMGRRCVHAHVCVYIHTHIHKHTIDSPYLAVLVCQTKHIVISTGVDKLDI